MIERTITTQTVEARAMLGDARKVRYFATTQEADEWFAGLRQRHQGVRTETIPHTTRLRIASERASRITREATGEGVP